MLNPNDEQIDELLASLAWRSTVTDNRDTVRKWLVSISALPKLMEQLHERAQAALAAPAGVSRLPHASGSGQSLNDLLDVVDELAQDWMKVGLSSASELYDPNRPYDRKQALETTQKLKDAITRLSESPNS